MKQATKEEVVLVSWIRAAYLAAAAGGYAPAGGASAAAVAAGDVPLITCKDCHRFKVVRRVSKQPWSEGDVFYCCPAHKSNGQGSPFFKWETDYPKLLQSKDLEEEDAELVAQFNKHMKMKQHACSLVIEPDQSKEDRAVVVVGSELIKLMKVQLLFSLCVLVVLVVIVVVMLFK